MGVSETTQHAAIRHLVQHGVQVPHVVDGGVAATKAAAALGIACVLLTCTSIAFARRRRIYQLLLALGAGSLLLTVLTHVCETFDLFAFMRWGESNSAGHFLDLSTAVLGIAMLLSGVLGASLSRFRHLD